MILLLWQERRMEMINSSFAKKLAPRGNVEIMEHAGYKARLMMAERLEGDNVLGLPPGDPVPVFPIAALPAAPEKWSREAGTYVCPVSSSWGLWFDWTMNDHPNTAIVPSVKGMNPITGQRMTTIDLEQYKDKCPIHGCDFSHERFCEECNYKWSSQNYVAYSNPLWWDGFRQPDGTVRQFFFTEDEQRDIASIVIGKENTVPAFGFAFFRRKNPVVVEKKITRGISFNGGIVGQSLGLSGPMSSEIDDIELDTFSLDDSVAYDNTSVVNSLDNFTSQKPLASYSAQSLNSPPTPIKSIRMKSSEVEAVKNKTVSVGAGAKIRQDLEPDLLEISEWNDEPSAIIRLYFVFEPEFKDMLRQGGIKDITGDDEGFLKDVPVG